MELLAQQGKFNKLTSIIEKTEKVDIIVGCLVKIEQSKNKKKNDIIVVLQNRIKYLLRSNPLSAPNVVNQLF